MKFLWTKTISQETLTDELASLIFFNNRIKESETKMVEDGWKFIYLFIFVFTYLMVYIITASSNHFNVVAEI